MARPDADPGAIAYEDLVERATLDQDVIGVILGGGRGKGVFSDRSDYDVYVVFNDLARRTDTMDVPDSTLVEVIPTSLGELRTIAAQWDHPLRWNRYTFAHVSPILDKTDDALQPVLDEMETVPHDHLEPHLRESLDGYINATYRSLKNRVDGNEPAAFLDAAESGAPLLEYLFGLDGRVRPYNKFIAWELDHHPLPGLDLSTAELTSAVQRVCRGDADAQRQMFMVVEELSVRHGLDDVIGAWGTQALAVLRG